MATTRSVRGRIPFALPLSLFALSTLIASAANAAETVNIYSYREPGLIDPILKVFTQETGIQTNVVYSKDGLVERLAAEGRNSPADVLLTAESGLLFQAKAAGVTQALNSDVVDKAVDPSLRDPGGQWVALTQRARVVYASKERVKQETITYEELADPKWKGKICIRSGQHTYNIALIAFMIAHLGEEKAEKWLAGLRDNLARKPAAADREGVRDIQAGLCDLSIGNTYYMAQMLKNPEQKPWADAVRIIFPDTETTGTHVNVSGGALTANAPHRTNAVKLFEFLVSPEAQHLYAELNGEYPVVKGVEASDLVKSWGAFKADPMPLADIAALRKKASELVDKVRFDAGPSS